jgi:beta-1,4-mannosyltransferase
MLVTQHIGREPTLAAADALRALSSMDWTATGRRPGVVVYLPVFRGNPYQALLYSQLPSVGFRALPLYDAKQAGEFVDAVAGSEIELVVHQHWLNVVTARAEDEHTARDAVKVYLERMQEMKERGARILWTVHNILPHETTYPGLEVELRNGVVQVADRIHVMSPRTRELISPWYDIPEDKLIVVPHPNYHGVYPSWISREQARLELSIAPDAVVFLLIGRIKPYKGLAELTNAFDELVRREPGRLVLIVAGPPDQEDETLVFREWAIMHPSVVAAMRKIPDSDLQVYLRAADVAVFPYRRSLNSGALCLALTFGLPVVLPSHSGEAASMEQSYAEIYDAESPTGLLDALSSARRLVSPEARAAAAEAGERIAAPKIAREFAGALREWIGGKAAP